MLKAVGKALAVLRDPALKRLFWGSMGLSALLLALLAAAGVYGLQHMPELRWHWATKAVEILAGAGVVVGLILLAYPVAAIVISIFLENAAAKIEARDFPDDPPGREIGLWEGLATAIPFLFAVIGINLLALPLYFLLPGANIVLFFLVNGYLVGREYFELVAGRHAAPGEVRTLRRAHRLRVVFAGVIIAVALSVPILNLLAPLFGTALMVHVYKGLAAPSSA